jgi:HEAT repeat protein
MTGFALLLALLSQADDAAAQQALEQFRSAYARPDASTRGAAVTDLAGTRHDLVLRKLAVLLLTDEKEVRVAAARGLAAFDGHKKRAAAALAGALDPNTKLPDVLTAILQALGTLKEEAALPSILKFLRRRETAVASEAVAAVEAIHSMKSSMEPLIQALRDFEKTVKMAEKDGAGGAGGLIPTPGGGEELQHARTLRARILKTFQKWTGEKWPTAGEWEIWWDRQKKKGCPRKDGGR